MAEYQFLTAFPVTRDRTVINLSRPLLINSSSVTKLRLPFDARFLGTRSARPVRRQAVSSRRSAPRPCT